MTFDVNIEEKLSLVVGVATWIPERDIRLKFHYSYSNGNRVCVNWCRIY